MKLSAILHNTSVVAGFVGVLAILGAWLTQATGSALLGTSQEHLFSDATVLLLSAIWLSLGSLWHRWQETK